jgi:hypothetical protein
MFFILIMLVIIGMVLLSEQSIIDDLRKLYKANHSINLSAFHPDVIKEIKK